MEEKISCMLVRDLLPLYQEGLVRKTTEAAVTRHLEGCFKCREAYQELLEEQEQQKLLEEVKTWRLRRYLRRYRLQNLGMAVGLVLTLMGIVGSLFLLFGILRLRNMLMGYL